MDPMGYIMLFLHPVISSPGKKSKMKYTIIHAGGLSDLPGGKAPVKLGVDDKLREVKNLRIPRADIAKACVQALVSWIRNGTTKDG